MSETTDDATPQSTRPMLLPQAIVWVLIVCVGYALLSAAWLAFTVPLIPGPGSWAALALVPLTEFVVALCLLPLLLWRMGDRASARLVAGGLAGLVARSLVLLSLGMVGVFWATSAIFASTDHAPYLVLAAAVLGVAGIALALFLSRNDGFDEKTMSVDGVLSQPESYSPVASATSAATLLLGITVLLIVVGVAVRLAVPPLAEQASTGGLLARFGFVFSDRASSWLLFAGLGGLALVGIHRFRRSPAADEPDGR